MKKSQRLRLATLAAQATRTEAEQIEHDSLATLAAANPDASKDIDEAATPATLSTVLSAAFHSLRGKNPVAADLAAANASIKTLTAERDAATAKVTALESAAAAAGAQLSALNSQLTAFAGFFALDVKTLSGKSPVEVAALLAAKISAAAIDEVASMGVPVGKLPAVTSSDSADAKEMSHAEFSKLSPAAKMNFCTNGGKITDLPTS